MRSPSASYLVCSVVLFFVFCPGLAWGQPLIQKIDLSEIPQVVDNPPKIPMPVTPPADFVVKNGQLFKTRGNSWEELVKICAEYDFGFGVLLPVQQPEFIFLPPSQLITLVLKSGVRITGWHLWSSPFGVALAHDRYGEFHILSGEIAAVVRHR